MALWHFLILCLLGTKQIRLGFVVVVTVAAAAVLFGWVVWFFFFFAMMIKSKYHMHSPRAQTWI